jgi:hypothetical protein
MTSKTFYRYLPLVALMAATRIHHFGNAFFLPDASLAVFFLAGLFFNSRAFFVALLAEAALLDYVAISQFNVSDFCISSAYVFLIPTYFAMWFGGRFSANFKSMQSTEFTLSISAMATLFIATSSAYLISNSSFYLLSDNVLQRDFSKYVEQLSHYYAPYMGYAVMYVIAGFAAVKVAKMLPDLSARKTA